MDDGCTQKSLFDPKSELTPRRAYCAFLAGQGASFLLGHNVIDHDSSTLKKQASKLPRTPLVDRSVMADSKPRDYAHFRP